MINKTVHRDGFVMLKIKEAFKHLARDAVFLQILCLCFTHYFMRYIFNFEVNNHILKKYRIRYTKKLYGIVED